MSGGTRKFQFKAYLPSGSAESGLLEALDVQDASRKLAAQGKIPIEVKLASASAKARSSATSSLLGGLFGARLDLPELLSDLSVMLNSGFNIDVSLRAVGQTQPDRRKRERIMAVHSRIAEGSSVSDAFALEPEVPADMVALISSGEHGGHLGKVFAELSKAYSEAAKRRSEIIEALLYPGFLITVLIGTLLLLALYLVPAIEPIFDNGGGEKPFVVAALSGFGSFVSTFWPTLLIGLGLLFLGTLSLSRSEGGKRFISAALLRLPLIGTIMRRSSRARYLRSMALLLDNGVQLNEAMRLSAASTPLAHDRHQLDLARERVSTGQSFSDAVAATGVFDAPMISLFQLGEESNSLGIVMDRAATMTEFMVKRSMSRALSFLTPAITILMGLVIGSLVISVMTTLLSINELAIR
ncbi:MAG: type II secretion system F family protein [Pseudomonadota bacterium]